MQDPQKVAHGGLEKILYLEVLPFLTSLTALLAYMMSMSLESQVTI